MISAVIFGLSLLGALNAWAAVHVYCRERRKEPHGEPGEPTCTSVFQTPQARVFGLPNGAVGLGYYLIAVCLIIAVALGAWQCLLDVGAAVAVVAAAFSIYLKHVLLFRLRMSCRICLTGNVITVALAVLWAVQAGWL